MVTAWVQLRDVLECSNEVRTNVLLYRNQFSSTVLHPMTSRAMSNQNKTEEIAYTPKQRTSILLNTLSIYLFLNLIRHLSLQYKCYSFLNVIYSYHTNYQRYYTKQSNKTYKVAYTPNQWKDKRPIQTFTSLFSLRDYDLSSTL